MNTHTLVAAGRYGAALRAWGGRRGAAAAHARAGFRRRLAGFVGASGGNNRPRITPDWAPARGATRRVAAR
jgi:hypothetical protein